MAVFSVILSGLLLMPGICMASADFAKYSSIIERKPFGTREKRPEPKKVEKEQPPEPVPQLSRFWRLSTITVIPGLGTRVGLENKKTKNSHFLGLGESAEGVTVVDADYDEEKVLLKSSGYTEWLAMDGIAQGGKGGSSAQAGNASQNRSLKESYARRLAKRREALTRHRKVEPPKVKGEELKEKLHELNMKYIREGKPPLPIQLTPEEDRQLVEEGVLPPRE
jgi:hypothetical protein